MIKIIKEKKKHPENLQRAHDAHSYYTKWAKSLTYEEGLMVKREDEKWQIEADIAQ